MTRWTTPGRAAACLPRRFLLLRTLLVALPACAAGAALAQTRPFPDAALRGRLRIAAPPAVELDGKPDQLAPGARIRDRQNLFVTSGTLVGQELLVNYLREPNGQIIEVWVLTQTEAAVRRPHAGSGTFLGRLFGP